MEIEVSYSYLSASIYGVQSRWVETLRDIRAVTNRKARDMYLDELRDIYAEAEDLIKYQLFQFIRISIFFNTCSTSRSIITKRIVLMISIITIRIRCVFVDC